jgi:hypothetical protein
VEEEVPLQPKIKTKTPSRHKPKLKDSHSSVQVKSRISKTVDSNDKQTKLSDKASQKQHSRTKRSNGKTPKAVSVTKETVTVTRETADSANHLRAPTTEVRKTVRMTEKAGPTSKLGKFANHRTKNHAKSLSSSTSSSTALRSDIIEVSTIDNDLSNTEADLHVIDDSQQLKNSPAQGQGKTWS